MLVLLTFLLRIKKMSQKKSVIFKHLLPVIKQYQQVGFTHEKIVALLRDCLLYTSDAADE